MKLISLHLPERYLDHLNRLVEENKYPNRSEAIRVAIRDLVFKEYQLDQKIKKKKKDKEV